jgi:hypothetical protein
VSACSGGTEQATSDRAEDALSQIPQYGHKRVCAESTAGYAACHARVRIDPNGNVVINATPQGLTPANLHSAYNLPSSGGSGKIVAIVDAQDDPNAESDLAVYRQQFGLPPCTTANGCFQKVNQSGQASPLPSAVCPDCKILLVEANSASTDDLGAAVNTAVSMGAAAVSNSYGGSEDSTITAAEAYYNHPGVLITASSGDNGYGVEYPASSAYVLAVGGTSLTTSSATTRGWVEAAWSGAGAGCSKYIAKPSWQHDTGCSKRTVADVSAVADPNTGVAVYDTYGGSSAGAAGWEVYGGTSVASPLMAATWVLTGRATNNASFAYANLTDWYDVTTGNDGTCSGSASYLCTAGAGYDGPTGLGTPNGNAIAGSSSGGSDAGTGGGGGGGTAGGGGGGSGGGGGGGGTAGGGGGGAGGGGGGGSAGGGGGGGGGGGSISGTCSHNICSTGTKLTSSCSTCAHEICAQDSYCCHNRWDSICVSEVGSICGDTCQ